MNQIVIENRVSGNLQVRAYHLPVRIAQSPITRLHPRIMAREEESSYREQLGDTGLALVRELFAIDWIDEMYFNTHSFSVFNEIHKHPWPGVDREIISALEKHLHPFEAEVVVVDSDQITSAHYHPEDSARPGFAMPA